METFLETLAVEVRVRLASRLQAALGYLGGATESISHPHLLDRAAADIEQTRVADKVCEAAGRATSRRLAGFATAGTRARAGSRHRSS
jgi:hypothetical protein